MESNQALSPSDVSSVRRAILGAETERSKVREQVWNDAVHRGDNLTLDLMRVLDDYGFVHVYKALRLLDVIYGRPLGQVR